MLRDINSNYLTELAPLFPPYRLSEEGDYPELAKDIIYDTSTVPADIAAAQKKP